MWICYISGSSGWFIFWSTLGTNTEGTLRVGCSFVTLGRASWLRIFSVGIFILIVMFQFLVKGLVDLDILTLLLFPMLL